MTEDAEKKTRSGAIISIFFFPFPRDFPFSKIRLNQLDEMSEREVPVRKHRSGALRPKKVIHMARACTILYRAHKLSSNFYAFVVENV